MPTAYTVSTTCDDDGWCNESITKTSFDQESPLASLMHAKLVTVVHEPDTALNKCMSKANVSCFENSFVHALNGTTECVSLCLTHLDEWVHQLISALTEALTHRMLQIHAESAVTGSSFDSVVRLADDPYSRGCLIFEPMQPFQTVPKGQSFSLMLCGLGAGVTYNNDSSAGVSELAMKHPLLCFDEQQQQQQPVIPGIDRDIEVRAAAGAKYISREEKETLPWIPTGGVQRCDHSQAKALVLNFMRASALRGVPLRMRFTYGRYILCQRIPSDLMFTKLSLVRPVGDLQRHLVIQSDATTTGEPVIDHSDIVSLATDDYPLLLTIGLAPVYLFMQKLDLQAPQQRKFLINKTQVRESSVPRTMEDVAFEYLQQHADVDMPSIKQRIGEFLAR